MKKITAIVLAVLMLMSLTVSAAEIKFTDVKETDKSTGKEIPAQFEVNLQTEKLQAVLKEKFSDFEIMKTAVSEQQYDIPRGDIISDLKTKVVTFVARKK